jgi:hypothetical protein
MTDNNTLDKTLAPALAIFDNELAETGVPLSERVRLAAQWFARTFVTAVSDEAGQREMSPEEFDRSIDWLASRWFRIIYQETERWYQGRYGPALNVVDRDTIRGAILIYSTPFLLRVPFPVSRPGVPGETAWLTFPVALAADESALPWVIKPPIFEGMDTSERAKAEEQARKVAEALRGIKADLMGVGAADAEARSLLKGVIVHLEHAADLALSQQPDNVLRAYWELQMACEVAFKGLLKSRDGGFPETHDLFRLFDALDPDAPIVLRNALKRLPRPDDVLDARYALGTPRGLSGWFKAYHSSLNVLETSVRRRVKLNLRGTGFELARPPWFRDVTDPAGWHERPSEQSAD